MYRLKKENEDLQRLSERLRDHLEKSRAQLDFHHRNGCSIDHLEVFIFTARSGIQNLGFGKTIAIFYHYSFPFIFLGLSTSTI